MLSSESGILLIPFLVLRLFPRVQEDIGNAEWRPAFHHSQTPFSLPCRHRGGHIPAFESPERDMLLNMRHWREGGLPALHLPSPGQLAFSCLDLGVPSHLLTKGQKLGCLPSTSC